MSTANLQLSSLKRAIVAICLAAAIGTLAAAVETTGRAPAASGDELRALWVLRTSLTSPASITALVRAARQHGFNALFVQVRGRGDAYYSGSIEPRAAELKAQPASFDPLRDVLRAARAEGLRVHAWVNVNLVSSAVHLPRAPEHLIRLHPDWLMVPRDLAGELARMDARSPAYVARLARWTRAQSDVEGLYVSPIAPGAADHAVRVVGSIARRYEVDGIHLDYVRYPTDGFDYSRTALAEFRRTIEPRLAPARRRELATRARRDPFAYPDALADEWRQFRRQRMTSLLSRLRDTAKAERPSAIVSVAAAADIPEALDRKLQEWPKWIETGLIDAVAPMAYTTEPERFAKQIAAARAAAGPRPVWAGIGAYRLSPAETVHNIATARRLGAGGIILFSYDSLTASNRAVPNYLAAVARGAFGAGAGGTR